MFDDDLTKHLRSGYRPTRFLSRNVNLERKGVQLDESIGESASVD